LEKVKLHKINRLVIDGIDGLKLSASFKDRVYTLITALMIKLKALNVTVLLIEEASLFGQHPDRQVAELSAVNENLIYGRYREVKEDRIRIISLVKVRNGTLDSANRIFTITPKGFLIKKVGPRSPVTKEKK